MAVQFSFVRRIQFNILLSLSAVLMTVSASVVGAQGQVTELDREIDKLKSDVANLSLELFEVEEAVLHPADTQVSVFLSLKDKEALELESVELYLDGSPVASHLYTERERQSLRRGGVQRLYIGNLPYGRHELKAVVSARSSSERYVRREIGHGFQKEPGASKIQMIVDARAPDFEPVVSFNQWK